MYLVYGDWGIQQGRRHRVALLCTGVGVIVGPCLCLGRRASDGLNFVPSCWQTRPEAVLTEDGTECHLENKKGLCVVLGEGWGLGARIVLITLRLPQPDLLPWRWSCRIESGSPFMT